MKVLSLVPWVLLMPRISTMTGLSEWARSGLTGLFEWARSDLTGLFDWAPSSSNPSSTPLPTDSVIFLALLFLVSFKPFMPSPSPFGLP